MRNLLLVALLLIQSQSATSPVAIGANPYPGFHPKSSGPLSFEILRQSRDAFETVAAEAGLNVIFLRDYQSAPVQLKLDSISINEALDALSAGSKSLWQPYDDKTIIVANDSYVNHRDLDVQRLQTFFLKNANSPQQVNDIVKALRQELSLKTISGISSRRLITVNDAPAQVSRAGTRIAELDKSDLDSAGAVYETDAAGSVFIIEGGDRRNITPRRSRLQPLSAGRFSFDLHQSSRSAFETIAAKAGLTAVFDRDYLDSPIELKLNDVDIDAALDLASMASGNYGSFWQPIGRKSIFIANGTSTKHRDYDSSAIDVITLTGPVTSQEVNDVMNATRQLLNLTSIVAVPRINTLVLKDTPAKIALAERFIAELERHANGAPPVAASAVIARLLSIEIDGAGAINGSGTLFNIEASGVRRNITPNRSQLQPKTTRPFSLRIVEDVQRAYEILGETGGINVRFDSSFKPGAVKNEFRFDDVDLFDALDILSLQTRTFWQVVDSKTIVVADDSFAQRRVTESQISRTFHLVNIATPQDLSNIVNCLRQILNLTQLTSNAAASTVDIRDTLNKVALSEKLIAALDKLPSN